MRVGHLDRLKAGEEVTAEPLVREFSQIRMSS